MTVWKSKVHGTFVLNHRVDLHAIDAPDSLVDFHTGSRTRLQEARVRVLERQDHGRLVGLVVVRLYT